MIWSYVEFKYYLDQITMTSESRSDGVEELGDNRSYLHEMKKFPIISTVVMFFATLVVIISYFKQLGKN